MVNSQVTIKCKLVAFEEDNRGYITYVWENLELSDSNHKYIMCTLFPHWNLKKINMGEIGFVTYLVILAGVDTWFNGMLDIAYRYNMVLFLKFVAIPIPKLMTYLCR